MTSTTATLLSIALVSLASLSGVILLSLKKEMLNKILLYLVSLATGSLLGAVFFHLLPEGLHDEGNRSLFLFMMLAGILASFILEEFLHFRHCHSAECTEHKAPLGIMMTVGDGFHNILDGMLIAASYLVSIELGVATTVSVVLHEIPQEVGDFAVLLHSGFSRLDAIVWNGITALTAFVGAGLVLVFDQKIHGIEKYLLPIAAGHFLYIAATDLLPELHRETALGRSIAQFVFMLVGIAIMAFVGHAMPH